MRTTNKLLRKACRKVMETAQTAECKTAIKKRTSACSSRELGEYLTLHYKFRFNTLTGQSEYRPVLPAASLFLPLGKREQNALCISLQDAGFNCWDRDLSRYINSTLIKDYHPFLLYFQELPKWDGTDRLTNLAARISRTDYWIRNFHRWMLAVTAQWMGLDTQHANSMVPLLISSEQGWLKSTFCRSLMPEELLTYYTDQAEPDGNGNMEHKLALMGLINLDEFDRLSPRRMAQLKSLIQTPSLNLRKVYQGNYCRLPRIASFIGTSNRKDLLTDPTGSRRFLCVEPEHKIDCSGIELTQIYAQLKAELLNGKRYWFTSEEEQEIQYNNAPFYQTQPEEELFRSYFRATKKGEIGELYSLAEILDVLHAHQGGMLRNINLNKFGNALIAAGVERVHTRTGNRYRLVRLEGKSEGCED